MDNASIHHVQEVRDMIENQGNAKLIFLPHYSPDLNPSEEEFNKVKDILRKTTKFLSLPVLLEHY